MITQEIFKELIKLPFWREYNINVSEKNLSIASDLATHEFTIFLHFPAESLYSALKQALALVFPEIKFHFQTKICTQALNTELIPNPLIKNIIAIASGKGGVGKSTVAVNLALALQAEGASVGILDADIYGPSLPTVLGIVDPPASDDGKTLQPIMSNGLQVMSIGFLLQEKDSAMIWRGPMVSTALQQLYRDCQWKNLDYLIIDLPPGTGDIQLTLAQKIPVTGAVIVTTPQDMATIDAQKAFRMFEKVNVPVLGVVENMSAHTCENCGHIEYLFGSAGGERIAEQYHLNLLGKIPLASTIRHDCDQGKPTVVNEPNNPISISFRHIAIRTAALLAAIPVHKPSRIPKVVVG
jgi:ATP-binding protein involved in chromosome partitioning